MKRVNKTSGITAPRLWTVLAKCHRALSLAVEGSITSAGLCLSDFMVLESLLHKGPLTISEMQEKILLASGSMTAAVDRVERKGLIVRRTTPEDRRARILELTEEGRELAKQVFKQHARDLEGVMAILNEGEKERLYHLGKKLGLAAMSAVDGQPSSKGKQTR